MLKLSLRSEGPQVFKVMFEPSSVVSPRSYSSSAGCKEQFFSATLHVATRLNSFINEGLISR
ncbi:unnamed protein product [Ilex paraguariensis]|uniref:Uncharacterized protein n=1 Tax=Ilex paraguariensis TaxID=185542 RepID=A0ABC8QPU1_9AQUA